MRQTGSQLIFLRASACLMSLDSVSLISRNEGKSIQSMLLQSAVSIVPIVTESLRGPWHGAPGMGPLGRAPPTWNTGSIWEVMGFT